MVALMFIQIYIFILRYPKPNWRYLALIEEASPINKNYYLNPYFSKSGIQQIAGGKVLENYN
jgi:hypothetical protein